MKSAASSKIKLTLENFDKIPITKEDVNNFSNALKDYLPNNISEQLDEIKNNRFSRFRSWDYCYTYFQTKWQKLQDSSIESETFDNACLHLGFYFASFGMLRGSSLLLQCSREIYRTSIYNVFQVIKNNQYSPAQIPVNPNAIRLIDDKFRASLEDELNETFKGPKQNVSVLLRQKFLLGLFGATPAFDINFKGHFKNLIELSKYPLPPWLIGISSSLSKENIIRLCLLNKLLDRSDFLNDLELKTKNGIVYPNVRKLDLILWSLGNGSQS